MATSGNTVLLLRAVLKLVGMLQFELSSLKTSKDSQFKFQVN